MGEKLEIVILHDSLSVTFENKNFRIKIDIIY